MRRRAEGEKGSDASRRSGARAARWYVRRAIAGSVGHDGATRHGVSETGFDMFHRRCGHRVTLSNNNCTATRNFSEYNYGLVFSAEPLQDDELFEVTIDKKVCTRARSTHTHAHDTQIFFPRNSRAHVYSLVTQPSAPSSAAITTRNNCGVQNVLCTWYDVLCLSTDRNIFCIIFLIECSRV